MRGRKPPRAGDSPRHRVKPVHEWTEIENVPFEGEVPVSLPSTYSVSGRDGRERHRFSQMTKQWWASVTSMPHCVLWEYSDWMFALSSAHVAEQAFLGVASAAVELRNREKVLGTTADYRRDLRIRYVDPDGGVDTSSQEEEVVTLASVASL